MNPLNITVTNAVAQAILGRQSADVEGQILRDRLEIDLVFGGLHNGELS